MKGDKRLGDVEISMAEVKKDINYIKKEIIEVKDLIKGHIDIETLKYNELKNVYVNKEEFVPVQRVVYGVVGLILTAVISAMIYLVVK